MSGCVLLVLLSVAGEGEKEPTAATERLIVRRPDVQKHLEIVEDQASEMERIGLDSPLRREMMEVATDKSIPLKERMEKTRELHDRLQNERARAVRETLLPHQIERLEELAWQYMIIRDPLDTVSKAVPDLSHEQKNRMAIRAMELDRELRDIIRRHKEKARDELLKELNLPQERRWRSLRGEPFDFSERPNVTLQRSIERFKGEDEYVPAEKVPDLDPVLLPASPD